ncbi:MAG TPA: tetratricopeptide repeat protein [Vicinamibacterales bacterium]|nr:tetratricopeptide repeat protein [Vicinamibacterales bacterium]
MIRTSRPAVYLALGLLLFAPAAACHNPEVAKRKHLQAGDGYLAKKQYDSAILEYRLALQQDDKFGEAYYKLAEALAANDQLPASLPEYVRAADLLPDNIDIQVKAGTLLLVARRFEDAKTRARFVLERHPDSVPGLVLLANSLAALQDLDNAVAVTAKAAALDPTSAGVKTNLGTLQLAKGDRRQAEATFKLAVATDPKSMSARLALSNFYASGNQYADAVKVLKDALALEPQNVRVNRALAMLHIDFGHAMDARPYLETASNLENTAESSISLADYFIGVGLPENAVEILRRVPTSSPSYTPAALRIALITYASGKHDEGLKIVKDIQTNDRRNPIPYAFEARLYLSDHRTEQALSAAKEAIAIDPNSAIANLMLGKVQLARGMVEDARNALTAAVRLNPTLVDAHIELARIHMGRAELDTSISYAEQGIKYGAQRLDAQLSLVKSLMARPDTMARAESQMRSLLSRYPNSSDVQVTMGALLTEKGDYASARKYFNRAVEIDPKSVAGLSGLTALDAKANRVSDAAARIDKHLAMAPRDPGLLLMAAKFYGLQGDRPRTEALLKRLIEADPTRLDGYNLLGQMYVTGHQLPQAKAQFEELARREPQSEMAAAMLGLLNQAENNLTEAEKWYMKSLAINARGVLASNNLAWICAVTETKLDYGLELARNAWVQAPEAPEVNDTLGWVYYKRNQASLAITPLQKAVERAPQDPTYHFHLGMAYAKLGSDANARTSLQTALKLNPGFAGAEDARRVLRTLVY